MRGQDIDDVMLGIRETVKKGINYSVEIITNKEQNAKFSINQIQ